MYAASAIAANTIARSACGAAAPLFTLQMFKAMGVGGGGSLIGGVAAVLAVIPFLFSKYGKQIRARSKFSPTKAKPAAKEDEEELAVITAYAAYAQSMECLHVADMQATDSEEQEQWRNFSGEWPLRSGETGASGPVDSPAER
ncbi:hypothetical protein CDD83_944 [Cordyceps sp. RAO-2017]|nr:hypothetical protein CDD83_944 [Cordyceps sp. RAO-2017]